MAARSKRCRSAAARLLRLWVRIPPGAWMHVSCDCCVFSDRGLRRAHHSYRWVLPTVARRCVWSRNLVNEKAMAHWGDVRPKKKIQSVRMIMFLQMGENVSYSTCTLYKNALLVPRATFRSHLQKRSFIRFWRDSPQWPRAPIIHEVSRSHITTHHSL